MNKAGTDVTVWMDVISPYACLAMQRLPALASRQSVQLRLRPVLFAGLLKHWGQLGPAEIPPKREWTYRHVAWLAHSQGLPLQMPAVHPFNPLPLLRLLLAQGVTAGTPGEADSAAWLAVFAHTWSAGLLPDAPERLDQLAERLAPGGGAALQACAVTEPVKALLRTNTEEAIARNVFGVPTMETGDRQFFGFDALPMLEAYLAGDAWLGGEPWVAAAAIPIGVARRAG